MAFSLDKVPHAGKGGQGSKQLGPFAKELMTAGRSTAGFARSMRDADAAVNAWSRAASSAAQIKPPAMPEAKGAKDGGGLPGFDPASIDRLESSLARLPKEAAVGPALAQEFNAVGGTVITMFRRIDAAMKFPAIDRAMTKVNTGLLNFSTSTVRKFLETRAAAKQAKAAIAEMPPVVREAAEAAGLLSRRESLAGRAAAAIAAPWNNLRAKIEAARAEMERASHVVPPAGRRPGVGRAVKLPASDVSPAMQGLVRLTAAGKTAAATLRDAAGGLRMIGTAGFVVVRTGAQLGAGFLGSIGRVGQGIARWRNWTSSLGDVAKRTYSQLIAEHGLVAASFAKIQSAAGRFASAVVRVGTLGMLGKGSKDAAGFGANVRKSTEQVKGLGGSLLGVAGGVAAAFGFVGLTFKVADFFKSGITGAINLNETVSKTKEVFGGATGSITAQADELTRKFGLVKGEQLDVASAFGLVAQGAGQSEAQSAQLANTFTKLAADASSFYNLPFAEAADKLRSGLTGEMKPLKDLGVVINETTVKAEALRMGLAAGKGELSESAKVAARASLIEKGLAAAHGDLERTADGAANQFRKAGGGISNFATRIGELLMPAVTTGITAFNEFLAVVIDVFEANLPTVQGWFSYIGGAMDQVGKVTRNFGTYWQVLTLRVGEFGANAVAYLEMLPENFGTVTAWLGRNWQTLLGDMIVAAGTFGQNLYANFKNLGKAIWEALKGGEFSFSWTPLMQGFKAETEKFPELMHGALTDVQPAIDALYAQMNAKEAKLAADRAARANAPRRPRPGFEDPNAEKKEKEMKSAAAAERGSSEAVSAIARHSVGGVDKGMSRLDRTTREQLTEQRKQTAALNKIAAKGGVTPFAF
jgi:hypothetical protein